MAQQATPLSDPEELRTAIRNAFHRMPVGDVTDFFEQLADVAASDARDNQASGDVFRLVMGLVLDAELSHNHAYLRAVYEIEYADSESRPQPIDHRALIGSLRAG
jgi:hypothetical protein